MSTVTVELTIIKNKKEYKFIIEDSYTFRNFSDVIAICTDFSKLLLSYKKSTIVCGEDGSCSEKIYNNYDNILNNFDEQFFKMVTSQKDIKDLRIRGRRQRILIDLDKKIYRNEDRESSTFDQLGKLALQELFHK